MKKKFITIFALVLLAICGAGFKGCKKSSGDIYRECGVDPQGVEISCQTRQLTPKGIEVNSASGVSAQVLQNVDAGLDTAFANARLDGYTEKLDHGFYKIYVPKKPCEPSPEMRVPSFRVVDRSLAYDGTYWDQINSKGLETDPARIANGYIYKTDGRAEILAAEMVLNLGTPTSTVNTSAAMIVCPDESVAAEGTNNGAEHILIANNPNDCRPDDPYYYYWDTQIHTIKNHRLLPEPRAGCQNGLRSESDQAIRKPQNAMLPIPSEITPKERERFLKREDVREFLNSQ